MKATISSRPAAAVAATAVFPNSAVIRVMTALPMGISSMPSAAGIAKRIISIHADRSCRHGITSGTINPCRR